ncbi:MAG: NADH-quinone oxidoreductase subunit J [Bacteroidota bacterium]
MNIATFFFYFFAALILSFGVLTVTTKQLFRSAIYLLFTLINIAALYFMLNYEFIAAVQVVVYVGGIVVLILFSLFLTQQAGTHMARPSMKQVVTAAFISLVGFGFVWWLLSNTEFHSTGVASSEYQVTQVGRQMLSFGRDGYVLPFEAVSILLLAALVGCVAIAYKQPKSE